MTSKVLFLLKIIKTDDKKYTKLKYKSIEKTALYHNTSNWASQNIIRYYGVLPCLGKSRSRK